VANPDYWAGRPKVDEVIFETYQNADTMAQDLKTGALAGAWGIPPAEVQSLNSSSVKSISYTSIGFDQLTFNCAPAPATGNRVLRDPAFRRALDYAIDKQKIATIAYNGQVSPATSMIPAGLYPASLDYHWQPSAAQQYPFDLAKASAALTAAGYPLKNGVRVDKEGKPIKLRLLARAESTMSQASGKLITGWFGQIGIHVSFQTVSEDTLSSYVYNAVKGRIEPSYDMFLWGWVGDADPNFLVSILTTDEIGMWNQSAWSDPAYDKLFPLQAQQLDPQQRKQTIWKMQQIVYDQTPFIPLIYDARPGGLQHRRLDRLGHLTGKPRRRLFVRGGPDRLVSPGAPGECGDDEHFGLAPVAALDRRCGRGGGGRGPARARLTRTPRRGGLRPCPA
jgi:peptide/nickel transport system substrate-binding protein